MLSIDFSWNHPRVFQTSSLTNLELLFGKLILFILICYKNLMRAEILPLDQVKR